jgi:Annexin
MSCTILTITIGTDELMLIQALAPLSNARIHAMKAKYAAKHDPMIDRLNSELSGDLHALVLALIRGERDENTPVDTALAAQQAEQLYEAGQGKIGTDEVSTAHVNDDSKRNGTYHACALPNIHKRLNIRCSRNVACQIVHCRIRSDLP